MPMLKKPGLPNSQKAITTIHDTHHNQGFGKTLGYGSIAMSKLKKPRVFMDIFHHNCGSMSRVLKKHELLKS